jgi:hypothetical protein
MRSSQPKPQKAMPRTRAGSAVVAAKFREKLLTAAKVNLLTYSQWIDMCGGFLHKQYLQSGASDPKAWHQHVFERDIGLQVADGRHIRSCKEST